MPIEISGMTTPSADVTLTEFVNNVETPCTVSELDEFDFSKFPQQPRLLKKEGDRLGSRLSLDKISFSDLKCFSYQMSSETDSTSKLPHSDALPSSTVKSDSDTTSSAEGHETSPMISEAWEALKRAKLHFRGKAIGTIAAMDSSEEKLNYDQVIYACLILVKAISVYHSHSSLPFGRSYIFIMFVYEASIYYWCKVFTINCTFNYCRLFFYEII